jgi:small subunit ribosomal protein S5
MVNPVKSKKSRKETREVELREKLVSVGRVTKVVKGGRRFTFSALVVVGDGKGRVGIGTGKAKEVPDAVKKAVHIAKSKMIYIPMKSGRTLHHDVEGKFNRGKVILRTTPPGTGVIAGGAMRSVFEVMGMQDVVAKSIGSTNPHNMVKATMDALLNSLSPKIIANRRSKKISDVSVKLDYDKKIDNDDSVVISE